MPAGYYEAVTVSTDITDIDGTITYTHHQCSNTENSATYTDDIIGTSNAASVNEITVNGKTVSTTQGGCYTKPYYYYSIFHPATSSSYTVDCDGYYIQDGYAGRSDVGGSYPVYKCSKCSYSQVGGQWLGHKRTVTTTTPASTSYHYGEIVPSNGTIISTYYLKNCGYTNGQLLSATITY